VLVEKFRKAVGTRFNAHHLKVIDAVCESQAVLESIPVPDFVDEWVT
jgi:hypothetical protein